MPRWKPTDTTWSASSLSSTTGNNVYLVSSLHPAGWWCAKDTWVRKGWSQCWVCRVPARCLARSSGRSHWFLFRVATVTLNLFSALGSVCGAEEGNWRCRISLRSLVAQPVFFCRGWLFRGDSFSQTASSRSVSCIFFFEHRSPGTGGGWWAHWCRTKATAHLGTRVPARAMRMPTWAPGAPTFRTEHPRLTLYDGSAQTSNNLSWWPPARELAGTNPRTGGHPEPASKITSHGGERQSPWPRRQHPLQGRV